MAGTGRRPCHVALLASASKQRQLKQEQDAKLSSEETGLSSRGYWVRKASLRGGAAEVERLKDELTMKPVDTSGMGSSMGGGAAGPAVFELWLESQSKLYLPKFFGLRRFGPPAAARVTIDPGEAVQLRFAGSLREEQLRPIEAFLQAARDPARMGGILSMPCGFGKTVVALHLVAALGVRTMVVVHKDFLLNQWRDRIAEFLPDARVGLLKAKVVDVEGKDVVLASLQSLSMKDYDAARLFRGIGFLVIDECHRVGTEVFSRALHKTNFRYSLGISATVTRKDGMTKAFVHFLGDVVFQGKRRADDAVVVAQLRYTRAAAAAAAAAAGCTSSSSSGSDPYGREVMIGGLGKPNVSRMINHIAEHAPRTVCIVDAIQLALAREPGRRVLVLSDRKRQLVDVRTGLERLGTSAGFYWGGMKREALAESETKQVMCATFAYAAEGMDVPGLDTLVLASPKSDIEQSVGRILRQKACSRVRVPMVVDIVDCFSLFERQAVKRAAFYSKHKYQMFDDLEATIDAAEEHARTQASSPPPPN